MIIGRSPCIVYQILLTLAPWQNNTHIEEIRQFHFTMFSFIPIAHTRYMINLINSRMTPIDLTPFYPVVIISGNNEIILERHSFGIIVKLSN